LSKEYIELNGFTMIAGANKKQDWKWEEWWERQLG
jgi:hypothetical protein